MTQVPVAGSLTSHGEDAEESNREPAGPSFSRRPAFAQVTPPSLDTARQASQPSGEQPS